MATPGPQSSAFLTAAGAIIDADESATANRYRLPTAPPKRSSNKNSAPTTTTTKKKGIGDATATQIRPPSFLILASNVVVVGLLAYAWRRVRRQRPA